MSTITRRDFLGGTALAIAAGLTPLDQLRADTARYYPPALTGLRGSHPGAFEVAHRLAREGEKFDFSGKPVEEEYDLVVVGGGISGLAAAWFYREAHGDAAKILIIENHDDFGGHAKRNEFTVDGHPMLIGYGGSEAMESPRANFSETVARLMKTLAVDVDRFDTAFDTKLYAGLGLSFGVFFDRENFGTDRLLAGSPLGVGADPTPGNTAKTKPIPEFIGEFPLSPDAIKRLTDFFASPKDYLAGKSDDEKIAYLESTSYRDYLKADVGLGEEGAEILRGPDARLLGSRHRRGVGLRRDGQRLSGLRRPRPSVRRRKATSPTSIISRTAMRRSRGSWCAALSRRWRPVRRWTTSCLPISTIPSSTRQANQSASASPAPRSASRMRPTARARWISAMSRPATLHRVQGKQCVLACYNMIIPYLMPELPDAQKEALAESVKAPLVYVNVVIRNWQSFVKLGVQQIYSPTAFFPLTKLDYPVALGGYNNPRSPDEPMVLHMVHVPAEPNQGLSMIDQNRIGRQKVLAMTFEDFENKITDQLDRMLGAGGFQSSRDIAAITVNRWPHGYARAFNSLFDKEPDGPPTYEVARARAGQVAIANSDAGWNAFFHEAIDQAWRAVGELKEA